MDFHEWLVDSYLDNKTKTLPKYIKALDKDTLEKVLEKTDAIRSKLQERMLEITKASKVRAEAKAKNVFTTEFLTEKENGNEAKQRAEPEASISGNKHAAAPVVPVPANMEAESETATKPTNKA